MIPWETLDTATILGGAETLRLKRRGTEFSIMLGAKRVDEQSPQRLGGGAGPTDDRAAAGPGPARAHRRPRPRLQTLRAALPLLPPAAKVTVVELVRAVVAWARGPLAALHGESLDDKRVTILEEDVGRQSGAAKSDWDAILLDVDNGPEGLSRDGTTRSTAPPALAAAPRGPCARRRPLRLVGGPDAQFTRRLKASGLGVEEIAVRAGTKKRGARHVVWVGAEGLGTRLCRPPTTPHIRSHRPCRHRMASVIFCHQTYPRF